MFRIGDFSKICQVPVSALRYYADLGLLIPAHIDRFTGFRYYQLDQLPRLNRILALRDLGLSLEEIGRLLHDELSVNEMRGMLRIQQAKLQQQVADEQARLARVAARLREIEKEGIMADQDVILKAIESQHVLSIRQLIPTPVYVGTLMTMAFTALARQGIQPIAAPQTIYHDEEFKSTDLDIELAIPVPPSVIQNIPLPDGRTLIAGDLHALPEVASLVHIGPYDALPLSYQRLGRWVDSNGCRLAGPPREIYLKAADQSGEPIVEVQWPVTRATNS